MYEVCVPNMTKKKTKQLKTCLRFWSKFIFALEVYNCVIIYYVQTINNIYNIKTF